MTVSNLHHTRCPVCRGRLYDIITEKDKDDCFGTRFYVLAKCLKCRNTITLGKLDNFDHLVQA